MASNMKFWPKWLPVLLPAAFLVKDSLATVVVLSNEPGITASNALHYSEALLPGSLLVPNGLAVFANAAIGFLLGWILYLCLRQRQAA
jgi:hypothetical protein